MTQDRLDIAGRTSKVIMITTKAVFYFLVSFPLEVQQVHACERFCFWFKSYLQWHSHTDQLKWLRNEFRLQWIRSNPCLPLVGKLQFVFVHFSSFFFSFFFRFDGTFNITYQTCYIVLILRIEGQFSRHFADYYSTLTYANFSRRFSHCWLWLARK